MHRIALQRVLRLFNKIRPELPVAVLVLGGCMRQDVVVGHLGAQA